VVQQLFSSLHSSKTRGKIVHIQKNCLNVQSEINYTLMVRALLADEAARGGQPTVSPCEPPGSGSAVTDCDLAALRAKFPFLKEFSDGFIKANKPDCLMRMETRT
jgi:hypothetical protein